MSQMTYCDVEDLSKVSTATLMTWHGQQMRVLHRVKGDKIMEDLIKEDLECLNKEIDKRIANAGA